MSSWRHRALPLAVAAALAIAAALVAQVMGAMRAVDQRVVTTQFQLRGADPPDDVVVVAIDDTTFSEVQRQWPFPRSLHARVIDRLRRAGASQIVYDVQFTEPSEPEQDLALYRSIARARNVVLATTEFDAKGGTNVLGGDENVAAAHARAAASNLPEGSGGVLDRFPYEVSGLTSLAVVASHRAGGPALRRSDFGEHGAWIDFRGGPGTVPAVSFSDVLAGRVPAARFRGRVVVVGATAPALQDLHTTPTSSATMAGPEIQANAIWTALHGLPLRSAGAWTGILLVILLGAIGPLLRLRLRVVPAVTGCVAAGTLYLVAAQELFEGGTIVLVAGPMLALAIGTVGMVVASHLFESAVRRAVAHDNDILEERVRERTRELRETQLEILQRLARAAEWRDEDTGEHIDRIGTLTQRLALALGLPADDAERLLHASTAHDIGKIGIPDAILLKPGPLDGEERTTMQRHASIGASMLSGSETPLLQLAEQIAHTHHERWDGTGYPNGLRGEEIPLAGRITAICDVFDALVSERPYKRAWSLAEALDEIRRTAGSHFDPALVGPFEQVALAAYPELYEAGEPGAPGLRLAA